MNTAVARRQSDVEWRPVPKRDDSQLQALLKQGWTIKSEELKEIDLVRENRTMVHQRRRAR